MRSPAAGALRLLRSWLALGGLCAGIVWGYAHPGLGPAAAGVVVGAILLGIRRRPVAVLVAVTFVGFAAGVADASLRSQRQSAVSVLASDFARCDIRARILEAEGALGTLALVEEARCQGYEPVRDPGNVMLPSSVADPGSHVWATGTLAPLQADAFDLARRRVGAGGVFDTDRERTGPPTNLVLRIAAAVRHGLLDATRALQPPERGLLRGLTIGDTNDLDPGTVEDFRRAGLSHLLAVSGENLAMLLGALALVVRRVNYRLRQLLNLGAIALFVLVVGPQPSVLRAAVMGAVMVAAVGRGQRTQPLVVLATALTVVLAFRPDLVFSVALQLSAAATAGIVLGTKPIAGALRWLPRPVSLPLAVTIAAQSAVAPILIATFGQLSLVSPLANLLAFPAVAPPTVLGLCAGVVSLLNHGIARLLVTMAAPFVGWISWVARSFGRPAGAAVDLPKAAAIAAAVPLAMLALHAAAGGSE